MKKKCQQIKATTLNVYELSLNYLELVAELEDMKLFEGNDD